MPITLKDKMKGLSPAQRKKVEARAAELIAEEMTLRELRHARKLTQVKLAKTLGVTQDSVSRLEKRSLAVHTPKNGRSHGRESFVGRRVSRPCASGSVRHCRR
jgi:DNA-binding XRE family transcriptional regulator